MENNAMLRRKGASRPEEVRLVEHRRAHNICIELSGIRKPFAEIKVGSSVVGAAPTTTTGGAECGAAA